MTGSGTCGSGKGPAAGNISGSERKTRVHGDIPATRPAGAGRGREQVIRASDIHSRLYAGTGKRQVIPIARDGPGSRSSGHRAHPPGWSTGTRKRHVITGGARRRKPHPGICGTSRAKGTRNRFFGIPGSTDAEGQSDSRAGSWSIGNGRGERTGTRLTIPG